MSERTHPSDEPASPTSHHVRRAAAGDRPSRDWLVEHLTPLLILQAERRMPLRLRRHAAPEDVVAEVWLVALAKRSLADIRPRNGRYAPVLVQYLTAVLANVLGNLARKAVRRPETLPDTGEFARSPWDAVPSEESGVVTREVRREIVAEVTESLRAFDADDQDLLVARFVEQRTLREIADVTGSSRSTIEGRLARLRKALAGLLPASLIDELA